MKLVTSIQILRPNIWLGCIIINGFELLVFIQIIYYNILYFSILSKVCYKIKLKMYSLLIYNGGFFCTVPDLSCLHNLQRTNRLNKGAYEGERFRINNNQGKIKLVHT